MKRADIEVGKEYLYCTSPDWLGSRYRADRLRVLDTDTWEEARWMISSNTFKVEDTASGPVEMRREIGRATTSSKKKGVLAMILDPSTGKDKRAVVVQPSFIRGPWEEALAEIDTFERARERSREQQQARQQAEDRRRKAIVEGFAKHGLRTTSGFRGSIALSLDDAEAVLAALESEEART